MNTTYLNPVTFAAGQQITFTEEGLKHIKPLIKKFENVDFKGTFEIIKTRETNACGEDDMETAEQDELTLGAETLKSIKTGDILDLSNDLDEDFWAFFTNLTPHLFNIV
ncbi:hypothetical protein ACX818_001338 [Acinetobacter baumannii]